MVEISLAVDSLAIQRALAILEERCHELRQIGIQRSEAWDRERSEFQQKLVRVTVAKQTAEAGAAQLSQQLEAQAEDLQQAHNSRDEQAALAMGLEEQLAALKAELERVTVAKQTAEAGAAQLSQQLEAQAEDLQQAHNSRDEQAALATGLEEQLTALKVELERVTVAKQTAEASAAQLAQQLVAQPESTARVQALELQLSAARDEARLLLLQLQQVQEELEVSLLFPRGGDQQEVFSPPALPATRQEDEAAINSNRSRLLSAA